MFAGSNFTQGKEALTTSNGVVINTFLKINKKNIFSDTKRFLLNLI